VKEALNTKKRREEGERKATQGYTWNEIFGAERKITKRDEVA